MFPVILETAAFQLRTLGVLAFAAFLVWWFVLERVARRRGLSFPFFEHDSAWILVGTAIAARFFGILPFIRDVVSDPIQLLAVGDGRWSLLGGGLAFFALLFAFVRRRKESLGGWAESATLAGFPLVAILALGALLDGQHFYGRATDFFLGMTVTNLAHPMSGVAAHPLPLYELAGLGILGAVFAALEPLAGVRRAGLVLGGFALLRGGLELLREDLAMILALPVPGILWLVLGAGLITSVIYALHRSTKEAR